MYVVVHITQEVSCSECCFAYTPVFRYTRKQYVSCECCSVYTCERDASIGEAEIIELLLQRRQQFLLYNNFIWAYFVPGCFPRHYVVPAMCHTARSSATMSRVNLPSMQYSQILQQTRCFMPGQFPQTVCMHYDTRRVHGHVIYSTHSSLEYKPDGDTISIIWLIWDSWFMAIFSQRY